MNEKLSESLQQFKQQLVDALRKALMHPQVEELYNKWLQNPEKTRSRVLFWTKITGIAMVLMWVFVGTFKLATNQMTLWKSHDLLETLVSYQIESKQLESEQASFGSTGGIYSGDINSIINPVLNAGQINLNTVKVTPGEIDKKKDIQIKHTRVDFQRITIKHFVELLHAIENGGANLSTHNIEMTIVERGWYQSSFVVHQALPQG